MKKLILISGLASFIGTTGSAYADCSANTRVTGNTLTTLITGNTICATQGNDKWQEQHRAGGQLWDYKKGPGDTVDPTEQVGTWSITSNTLTHSYGSVSYSYSVHLVSGNSYTLCGPSIINATIQAAPSCGF